MKPEPLRREIDFDEMEAIALAFRHTVKQKKNRELLQLRNETMGYLLLTTGIRAAELLSLQFSHIHEASSMNYIEFKGKREKWRRIPISTKSLYLINRLKMLMQIEEVINPYICFSFRGNDHPISYEALRLIVIQAIEKSTEDTMLSPHWFRRSFITKLLTEGISLIEVMQLVGHNSIATTNKYLQDINKYVDVHKLPYK